MNSKIDILNVSLEQLQSAYDERLALVASYLEIGVKRIIESINKLLGTNWELEGLYEEIYDSTIVCGVYDPLYKRSHAIVHFGFTEHPMNSEDGFYFDVSLDATSSALIDLGFPMETVTVKEAKVRIEVFTKKEMIMPRIQSSSPIKKKFLMGEKAALEVFKRDSKIQFIDNVDLNEISYEALLSCFTTLPTFDCIEPFLLEGDPTKLNEWYHAVKEQADKFPSNNVTFITHPTIIINPDSISMLLEYDAGTIELYPKALGNSALMRFILPMDGEERVAKAVLYALQERGCGGTVIDRGLREVPIQKFILGPTTFPIYNVEIFNGFGYAINHSDPNELAAHCFPNSEIRSQCVRELQDVGNYILANIEEMYDKQDFEDAVTMARIYECSGSGKKSLIGNVWYPMKGKGVKTKQELVVAVASDSSLYTAIENGEADFFKGKTIYGLTLNRDHH
ncbi:hypothetical protein [Paenibacillus xylanilyticus]|uniref:Uncharacterized protein n=1 Tax=Paenibacillus xylanilyticus TaxID=248903 RepID=A0A7Y6BTD4_9BACL|nr:hypothetical protein [Paenibacillus xylanilyticus]NUU74652.1 hypothetical protein [Paenibacillus xylanilyticus]